MRCPKCGCSDDKVIDSRSVKDGFGVRRRRECIQCSYRFTTLESVSPEELKVIKLDGTREEFDIAKLPGHRPGVLQTQRFFGGNRPHGGRDRLIDPAGF